MKKPDFAPKAYILVALGFALFNSAASAQSPSAATEYYIFARGLTNNTSANFTYSTDLNGNIKMSPRNYVRSVSYCVYENHITSIGVNTIGGIGLIIKQLVAINTKNEFTISFEACRYGYPTDFLIMQKNVADNIYRSGQWNNWVSPNFGLFFTIPKDNIISSTISYQNLVKSNNDNEKATAERLASLAISNGKGQVYSITLHRENFVSSDEGYTCTISSTGQDAQIINAVNHVIITNINNKNDNKRRNITRPLRFSNVYNDLDDLWSHAKGGDFPGFSAKSSGKDCNTYVDFAKNITVLAGALDRSGIKYIIREYDSTKSIINAAGFDTIERYQTAKKIGVDADGLARLESVGINTYEKYQSLAQELESSGYADSSDIYDMMSYIQDRSEGQKINKSAVFVKRARDQRARDAEARAAAAREACLTTNGYYRTANAAARSLIAKKC